MEILYWLYSDWIWFSFEKLLIAFISNNELNRYHFKDDSTASGFGALRIRRNLYRLQSGSFCFKIRDETYRFEYNIDKGGDEDDEGGDVRGSLSVYEWKSMDEESIGIQNAQNMFDYYSLYVNFCTN